jgi:hypothetical protein
MKPDTVQSARRPNRVLDAVENPYAHFIMSEAWAALAGISVYALFHLAAYAIEHISAILTVTDNGPDQFLVGVLSWGGAISASATFFVVSIYQLGVLIKRLWERFDGH